MNDFLSAPPPAQPPPRIDLSVPSVARIYDAMLGGKDHFESDRRGMAALEEVNPGTSLLAQANRAYLSRAVDHVARTTGVRQFLDLGAGLPTADNTHQIAQRLSPTSRVVYVDHDPIVLAHCRALLADNPHTSVTGADLCDVDAVLDSPETRRLIDLDQPVCLMLVNLLHCVPDDSDPFGVARAYFDRLPSGSHLVYSHLVSDDEKAAREFTDRFLSLGVPWGRVRSPEEAARAFDGWEILSPGINGAAPPRLVDCSTWRAPGVAPASRPSDPDVRLWQHAGVGRKR
ncbi:SAM-dependent methyltransferase [Marinactinospora thermotolerans]|uniref:S-adenosyl methyltransferase n=1 Tax=Marinactinospora thermotolerans DSM 45154 TaxID=1122192 RepID=A0A1T4K6Q3_9ACTN|nr:SAM-dependent methyltransferase [Marinactinospora thermotolerans]SJZ38138.1 S-adenosyl methyltransferase [Marinactinospora thermotolerans DSM 45154]